MPKQIVLHYAGSYVERPHTITFDSEREYEKFIQEKGYQLKPNVEYGVFTLNAVLRTQFQQSSISIEDVSETDKPDISTVTPPTLDIKYPQCNCPSDKEDNKGSDNNININITIPGLENITTNQGNVNVGNNQGNNQGSTDTSPKDDEGDTPTPPAVTPPAEGENNGDGDEVIVVGGEDENQDTPTQESNPTTPPADNQEGNQEEEDVVVIGGDDDTQNPTEGTDTDVADTTDTTTGTDTQTSTTDTDTTDETQDENQGDEEGFNRVGPVVSFGPEVTGNDGEESQTENTQDSGDSEIIIPDEGSSENTSPAPGDEDIIVL